MNSNTSKQKIKIEIQNKYLDKYLADLKDLDSVLLQEFCNVNDMYNIYQERLVEIVDEIPLSKFYQKRIKGKIEPMDHSWYIKVNKN